MSSFFRVFQFAFEKFFRNAWLSIMTILILMLALISVNFLIIFEYMASQSVDRVEERVDLGIHFHEDVNSVEIDNLRRFLTSLDVVEDVRYVSPEDALISFKERHKNTPEIMDSLNELDNNPLTASLVIKARSLDDYDTVIKILSDDVYQKLISNTSFQDYETLMGTVTSIITEVRRGGLIVVVAFIIMSLLIMYNTVRINVYTYRQEIGIMKLVGASNFFVRAPFIIESMIISFFALFFVAFIMYPIITFIQPYLALFFGGDFNLVAYFKDNGIFIFGCELLGLWLLNMIGSGFSVGRYIRV